ncbi:MAG: hypothetical protein ACTSUE_08520 [Promethearchaeota archaeon]
MPAARAAFSQWFPEEGTTCEYDLKYGQLTTSGNYVETTKFNVYNQTTSFTLVPTVLSYVPSGYDSVKNNTGIVIKHTYSSDSVSEWRRIRSLVVGGKEYAAGDIRVYISTGFYYNLNDGNTTVSKVGFYSSTTITDNINCSTPLGEYAYYEYNVTKIDSDGITAMNIYEISVNNFEMNTINARTDGRMKVFTRAYFNTVMASANIHSTYVTYTARLGTSFAFSMDSLIWIGIGAGIGIAIGVAIGISSKKK